MIIRTDNLYADIAYRNEIRLNSIRFRLSPIWK